MRIFLTLLVVAWVQVARAVLPCVVANAHPLASGGGGCPASPAESNTTSDGQRDFGLNDNSYYAGQRGWSNAGSKSICRVDFQLSLANGSIAGKTFTVKIWTLSGTSLDAVQATSNGVAGSDAWSGTFVRFDFASPFVTTGGVSYAITIDSGATDFTNNAALHTAAGSGGLTGTREIWDISGVFQEGSADDSCMKIYYP